MKAALKLYGKEEQLAQKFASFFPEQTSDQERVAAFLSQDAALIRQDYIQTFSPPPDSPEEETERTGTGVKDFLHFSMKKVLRRYNKFQL